jgi:hypothetical protein
MVKNEINITEIENIQNPEKMQKPKKKNRKTFKIRNFSGKSRRSGNTICDSNGKKYSYYLIQKKTILKK